MDLRKKKWYIQEAVVDRIKILGADMMENILKSRFFLRSMEKPEVKKEPPVKNLTHAEINREYVIKEIRTNDKELKDFLFTLGCYEGETITVISVLADNYIVAVKDARYSIDKGLAETVII